MTMQKSRQKRMNCLNNLMEKLCAPDLTLAEAKVVNERLRSLLDGNVQSPQTAEVKCSPEPGSSPATGLSDPESLSLTVQPTWNGFLTR